MTAELEYEHPTVEDEAARLLLLMHSTPLREIAGLYRYQKPVFQMLERVGNAHYDVLSLDNQGRTERVAMPAPTTQSRRK